MHVLKDIPTEDLIAFSQAEYVRYGTEKETDNRYSFELFRRAVNADDQAAWFAIYNQYRRLVAFWADGLSDTMDERVNETFTKFWLAGKRSNFEQKFEDFRMVMAYLKRIARNLSIDLSRKPESASGKDKSLDNGFENVPDLRFMPVHDLVEMRELYQQCLKLMQDEPEKLVWKLTLLGFSPREAAEEYSDRFTDVDEVYRIKERILLRLRSKLLAVAPARRPGA